MQSGGTEAGGGQRKAATERDKEKGRWEGALREEGWGGGCDSRQAVLNHTFLKRVGVRQGQTATTGIVTAGWCGANILCSARRQ